MKKNMLKLIKNWLLHCAVIWIALNISILISKIKNHDNSRDAWLRFVRHNLSAEMYLIFLFLLLTEISYQYFFRRYRLIWFIVISLLLGISGILMLGVMARITHWPDELLDLIAPILLIAAYNLLYALFRDYFYRRRHKQEVQLQQSQSELNALKAQLNPHFLFNSLNYLYGAALKEQATETADGIDKLSEMMRYTVTGLQENFVPLADELKFIENYLSLQRARLPEKDSIRIDVQVNVDQPGLMIAPLLLLSFIENAFKYGISIDLPCYVGIDINVTNGKLIFKVENSIIPGHAEVKGNNTGIKNTIKRLDLLYPGNYKLDYMDTGTGFKVLLTANLNNHQ